MSNAIPTRYVCPGCSTRHGSTPIGAGWELCGPCGRLWTADSGPVRPLELLALSGALASQPEVAARLRRAGDALITLEVMTAGVTRIALERARQISAEGRSPEADLATYHDDDLASSGACYALSPDHELRVEAYGLQRHPIGWGLPADAWKPGHVIERSDDPEVGLRVSQADRLRELEKAGALIAAEIDRLLALQAHQGGGAPRNHFTTSEGSTDGI